MGLSKSEDLEKVRFLEDSRQSFGWTIDVGMIFENGINYNCKYGMQQIIPNQKYYTRS